MEELSIRVSSMDGVLDGTVTGLTPAPNPPGAKKIPGNFPGIKIGYYGKNASKVRWIQFETRLQYLAYTGVGDHANGLPYQPFEYDVPGGRDETTPWGVREWHVDTTRNAKTGKLDSPIYTDGGGVGDFRQGNASWIFDNPTITPYAAIDIGKGLRANRVLAIQYYIDVAVLDGNAFAIVRWFAKTDYIRRLFSSKVDRTLDFVYPGPTTKMTAGKGGGMGFTGLRQILNDEYGADQKVMYQVYPGLSMAR
jgi:hypothetical protein